jgi:hypothetical protein
MLLRVIGLLTAPTILLSLLSSSPRRAQVADRSLHMQPLPTTRLRQISSEACSAALGSATIYDHSQTATWNNTIINSVLKQLISEAATAAEDGAPQYKWIVNTTIIQHLSDPRAAGSDEGAPKSKVGRRGMHSASGAFWNNERDGMWSYKHEATGGGEEKRGMDVVVSIMWVAV